MFRGNSVRRVPYVGEVRVKSMAHLMRRIPDGPIRWRYEAELPREGVGQLLSNHSSLARARNPYLPPLDWILVQTKYLCHNERHRPALESGKFFLQCWGLIYKIDDLIQLKANKNLAAGCNSIHPGLPLRNLRYFIYSI